MSLKQALQRIEELERRVRELESRRHNDPLRPNFAPPWNEIEKHRADEDAFKRLRREIWDASSAGCDACRLSGVCMCVRPNSGPQCVV